MTPNEIDNAHAALNLLNKLQKGLETFDTNEVFQIETPSRKGYGRGEYIGYLCTSPELRKLLVKEIKKVRRYLMKLGVVLDNKIL